MRLTTRGAALLVVAVLLWALGRVLGVAELYVVAVATAALVGCAAAAVAFASTSVSVRRGVTVSRVPYGGTAEVTLDLRNDARWDPVPVLLIEDDCPWVLADQPRFVVMGLRPSIVTHLRYTLYGSQRGRFQVGPVRLRLRDPFGVIEQVRSYSATDDVLVYPRVEPLPAGVLHGMHRGSGASEARRLFNAGDEFHTMRPYVHGDDLRLVHWRSTARQDTLMVRQQELPWQAEATVLLDARAVQHRGAGPESTFERAVSVAASVICYLADHGYRIRLVTDSDRRPPPSEPWPALLDRLAEIGPSREQAFLGLSGITQSPGEGLLVGILTASDRDGLPGSSPDVRALMQAGNRYSQRIAIVVHAPAWGADLAAQTAAVLQVARWRVMTLDAADSLAERWGDLAPQRGRRTAYEPDAAVQP
jgi:uncharacterized protein (DUF58 family)